MDNLLGFLSMMDNYDERKVANYDGGVVYVDTCAVNDSAQPYETAVAHPSYNGGDLVIVELYETKEDAQTGHDKWVAIMTAETLPQSLRDVSSAVVAELCDVCGDEWRTRIRE